MKRFLAVFLMLTLCITFLYVNSAYGVTKSPSEIILTNKTKETLYYFDPVPDFNVPGTVQEEDDVFVYRMGEVIRGNIDESISGTWIVALEKIDGTVIDHVSIDGGRNFSIATGNVPYDGKYKLVATDSLDSASQTWLISKYVYIKYNVKITDTKICQCPQKTSTVTGYVTRGNNQPPVKALKVCIAYPDGSLAAISSIPANSSGQFTLSFPSTSDLWYYHLYVSDEYPPVSPDNDAMIYASIANFSNIKWTLRPIVINPLLYDDEEGVLNQSLTLYLYDQDGKPVTGKKDYFYVGSGWSGYGVNEIAPGVYKISGGVLKGGVIAVYVKQAIRSNIVTINLRKLAYFNPYIHLNSVYYSSPYYDYTLGRSVGDLLPPNFGNSFEAEIGLYPIPDSKDPSNGKYSYKQDYFVYKNEISSFTGVETHKIGPDNSGTIWNDPANGIFTKPVYFVIDPSNISFTVSGVIWKRAKGTSPWDGTEPNPLSACCVVKPDYTFKFNTFGSEESCPNIYVSPKKVVIGEKGDLKIHVGNMNTIVHVYMADKNGNKVKNAFTASFKLGREEKIVDELWYNPLHITSTNIPDLPVQLSYQENIDASWKNGDVVFKNVAFNTVTVCPRCPRNVIVEVYKADGQTHPLCAIIQNAVEVDPVVKNLSATYKVVAPGGGFSDEILAGLREYIYVTAPFSYSDIHWSVKYNGKPIEDYGLQFTVEAISENTYKIVFDKPLPYDENYSPNKLVINAFAVNSTKTRAEEITLDISGKNPPEDTTPPKIEISYPQDGALLNKKVIDLKGKVTDDTAVSKLLIFNASASFEEDGSFDVPVTLKEGDNEVSIVAFDVSGNKTEMVLHLTVDTVPPELVLNVPQVVYKKEIKIKGKTDKGAVVMVGKHKIIATDGTFETPVLTLQKGENTITVSAVDKAGNRTTKTITVIYESKTVITLQPDNPMMTVNGVSQEIDPGRGTKPVIIPKWSRTVVPIRAIVEALGGTIEWDGKERKVTINFNGTTIELWIGKPQARVNGEMKWIDSKNHNVKPIIVNGRTMLPLRFVAESLGGEVDWDPVTRTITLTFISVP